MTELNGQKTAISETSLSGMYMLRMVEHAAVNRRVVGSSPTEGAIKRGCAAIYKGGGTFFVSLRVRSIRAFSSVG